MLGWMRHFALALKQRRDNRGPARRLGLEVLEDRCVPTVGFLLTNLTANLPGSAPNVDPRLLNPTGIALTSTGPIWVANSATGLATSFANDGTPNPGAIFIPPPSSTPHAFATPTGVLANPTSDFTISEGRASGPALLIFATADGTLAGWNPSVDPNNAVLTLDDPTPATGPVYTGLALGSNANGNFLYAANFRAGTIDVYNNHFARATLTGTGNFTDPNLPSGYAPYDVVNVSGQLYVTYGVQDVSRHNPVAGAGNGVIDVFDTNGNFVKRFAAGGNLNAPWGVAMAPSNFGDFSGDLLVGNYGDGHINAYNPTTGALVGTLSDATGHPIIISGLSGLTFGNGGAGNPTALYFAAGAGFPGSGLFGELRSNDLPLTATGQTLGTHPGVPFTGTVATFTDADPTASPMLYQALINWGDGTAPTNGVVTSNGSGGFVVTGAHTYLSAGNFNVTVVISDTDSTHDTGGATATATTPATVTDQPLTAVAQNLLPNPGTPFTVPVASFTDADPAATANSFTATINWGDGTSTTAGIVTANNAGPGFIVTGTHMYANSGMYQVTVTITDIDTTHDSGGAMAVVVGQATVGNSDQHYVSRLYQDLLNRAPDPGGLSYWVNVLKVTGSRQTVSQGILNSLEYQTDVLQGMYHSLLGRSIDSLGLQVWGSMLANGVAIPQIEAFILGSNEYYALHGGTNDGFVTALYQSVFNRTPTSNEVQNATKQFSTGMNRINMALGLLNGMEADQDQVQALFNQYLHRPADQNGLTSFTARLHGNVPLQLVIASITASDEYLKLG